MAPEQARGELDTLDERADVFALGSILCEILTRPARVRGADRGARSTARRSGPTWRTREAGSTPATPTRSWWSWRRSCLAAAPKHRPRDAGAVVARLSAYLGGVERRLREAELAQARAEAQAAGERRRRLLTLALAASVLATALIGAAGWAWMDRERQRRERSIRAGVDAALSEASKKRDRARDAGGVDPVAWVEAIEAARRAESLLGGGDAGARAARSREGLHGGTGPRARRGRGRGEGSPDGRAARRDPERPGRPQRRREGRRRVRRRRSAPTVSTSTGCEPEAAGRALAASPAVADLANALDHWAFLRRGPALRDPAGGARLVAAARAADPDPWRNRLRDTLGRMGGDPARKLEALERLAATADVDHLPGASVTRLAAALAFLGRRDTAIALLRRAQASHRDDFWVNADLGRELLASGRPEEAVRFFAVAAGVSPRSGLALSGLAKALLQSGQPSEAADILREVTRLRPDDALAHVALGSALLMLGEPHEADAEFREARRLKPDDWVVRDQIALARSDRGDWAAAVEEQRESVRRFPGLAVAHKALAHALEGRRAPRRRHRRIPRGRPARTPLPVGLPLPGPGPDRGGRLPGRPGGAGPRRPRPPARGPETQPVDAGGASGAPDRARAAAGRRREGMRPPRRRGSDRGIRPDRLLPALSTRRRPACGADAFAASPALAADPTTGNRYQAARAAALAGAESGRLDGSPDARSRARWREQAVAWLEADLAASAAVLESGTAQQRAAVLKRLGRWQVDPALAGLRDAQAMAGIPEPERRSLRDLWRRIDAVRAKAAGPQGQGASKNP